MRNERLFKLDVLYLMISHTSCSCTSNSLFIILDPPAPRTVAFYHFYACSTYGDLNYTHYNREGKSKFFSLSESAINELASILVKKIITHLFQLRNLPRLALLQQLGGFFICQLNAQLGLLILQVDGLLSVR